MTIKRFVLIGFACLSLFLLVIFVKVHFHAANEYRKGEAAFQAKNYEQAMTHYNRAIHWYSPGSRSIQGSIERLWDIGTQAKSQGELETALKAFRSLRSALYAARSFYTPCADWIDKCDDQIAGILVQMEEVRSIQESANRKADILKIMKTSTEPDVLWSVILEIGLLGWIGCTIGFIFRVFSGPKGFIYSKALYWGGFVVVFYAFWIIGMLKA